MKRKKNYILIITALFLIAGILTFLLVREQQVSNGEAQFVFEEPENFRGDIGDYGDEVPIAELTWSFRLDDASVQLPKLRELLQNNDEAGLQEFLHGTHNDERTREHVERFLATIERTPLPVNVAWTQISYGRQGDSIRVSYDTRDSIDDAQWRRYDFSFEYVGDHAHEVLGFYQMMGAETVDVTDRFIKLVRDEVIAYQVTYPKESEDPLDEEGMFQAYFIFKVEDLHVRARLFNLPTEDAAFEILNSLEFARGVL